MLIVKLPLYYLYFALNYFVYSKFPIIRVRARPHEFSLKSLAHSPGLDPRTSARLID